MESSSSLYKTKKRCEPLRILSMEVFSDSAIHIRVEEDMISFLRYMKGGSAFRQMTWECSLWYSCMGALWIVLIAM